MTVLQNTTIHVRQVRMNTNAIIKTAVWWTPEGNEKRGCTMIKWRKTVELRELNHNWSTTRLMAGAG